MFLLNYISGVTISTFWSVGLQADQQFRFLVTTVQFVLRFYGDSIIGFCLSGEESSQAKDIGQVQRWRQIDRSLHLGL